MITEDEINDAKTPNGGWTKDQLAKWNVPWPPPKGWKAEIIKTGLPYQHKDGDKPRRNNDDE